ncbi:hypothetical protein SMC26_35050 [Actinomadura fulvescens]|uniref:Integral membrane protein n=1 Tax=Actinomadura fulvescens TaxID=46160 RepID=A0ABN3QY82_9ACTN
MADDTDRTQNPHPGDTGPHPAETKVAGPSPAPTETSRHGRARRPRSPRGETMAMARKRAVNVVAWLISLVTTVVVLILAVHIVFVTFEANTANDLVNTVGDWADGLAWQFKDVFQPDDHKVEVAVNYGLAALVYLIVGRILTSLVRRLS